MITTTGRPIALACIRLLFGIQTMRQDFHEAK